MNIKNILRQSIVLSFLLLSLFRGASYSETIVSTLDRRTPLAGEWKIRIGDDPGYAAPGFNDAAWDSIDLPGNMMSYVKRKAAGTGAVRGVLWLRKTVRIDMPAGKDDAGLILGRIGSADETYFNGVRVGGMGGFPPDEFSMWNHPRHYPVHREFIRYGGHNVIAVRVSYYIIGEMLGEAAFTSAKDCVASGTTRRFLFVDLCYIIIAMGFTLSLIMVFFSILQPRDREYNYFWLQMLFGLFMVLELCTYWNIYGSQLNRFRILGISWGAVNVFHPFFLHRFYGLKRKKSEIVLLIYLAAAMVTAFIFLDDSWLREAGIIMILVTMLTNPYYISCHVSALVKKRPFAKLLSFFDIVVVMGAAYDGIGYLLKFGGYDVKPFHGHFQIMIFPIVAFGLFVATSIVLVVRFINMSDDVQDLNTNLENFVIENALLNKRLSESAKPPRGGSFPVINDRTEEKIQQVIGYLDENYTFDISREGLAATVDLHPDSLGKLFKLYTRKKLGDYINELRMKEAARRLSETDESVIQIAFSVGCDSLRTFNRVFPKIMGMTPEKYRQHSRKQ